jgi:hypothetical protein
VVEHLLSKLEALNSKPSALINKERKKENTLYIIIERIKHLVIN